MILRRYPRLSPYRWIFLLAVLLSLVALLPIGQRAARQSQREPEAPPKAAKRDRLDAVPGEILVRFRPGSKGRQLGRQAVTERNGRQLPLSVESAGETEVIVEGLRLVKVNPDDTSRAIAALRARSDVIYAEPNYIRRAFATPNDPRFPEMWGLKNIGQAVTLGGNTGTPGNDIRAEQAWDINTGSRNVVVGILDSGIDINHVDLHDNIWTNPGEIAGNGVDDDGNGFVDDIHGWDFAHNDASVFDYTEATYPPANPATYTGDLDAHGTHVAGTIGAMGNNGIGVVGVNWQVSLLPLKFLVGDGGGSALDLTKALGYVKTMRLLWDSSGGTKGANIRVINNSYGGFSSSDTELNAIRELGDLGILFVVAAGNEEVNNDLYPVFPANYQAANLISVAASNGNGTRASFSNFGEGTIHVTAPGNYILSTLPKNTYDFESGTSMSAPHVSGVAALVCAQSPNITMQRLRSIVMYSGYAAPWQFQNVFPISTGRAVDAGRALQTINALDVTAPGPISNFTAQIQDTFPQYQLIWQAAGDDGNVGRVTAYEVRFSDTTLTDANFDQALGLPGPVPTDPGFTQFVTVKVPWRHTSGFIGVRAVDEAGNKGPISQLPISVAAGVGDPYIMTETPATPLSTGGTGLGLTKPEDDDTAVNVNLPFTFRYYGADYTSVWVSTNGVLYFGFPRNDDFLNSERWVYGERMIAGLWDDLRANKRPGDDIYVVQDADHIIFRWQAVTFPTPIAPGVTRGQNPVSFEIELRFDGTITLRYGDGNQKLLPIVGIGGGFPEPYISRSHTSEFALQDLTNAGTVTFTRRNPVQRGVLTVTSTNPTTGVNVTVSPNDISGSGNGTTQFTRTYNPGTTVTLTAPATVNGNNFRFWQRDGQDWSGQLTTSLVMNGNHTMTAVYATKPVLTVTSNNPNTGVSITVTPNDTNGANNGVTPFTRTYNLFDGVNLTAPQTVGNSTFWKWQVDGVDYVPFALATLTMNADHTATAIYVTVTPTPTPTPVPGAGVQPLAFVKPGTGGGMDLFLGNTDGTSIVNLTDAAGDDTRPAWSPDGTRIAYTCLRQLDGSIGSPQRICMRNADGTGLTVLSKTFSEDFGPTWSHDGRQIAFTSFTPGFQSVMSFINLDSGGQISLFGFAGAANPDYSPNNLTLVFEQVNSIWTYNQLTQNSLRLTNLTGDSRPRFSPNGSKIVFQSTRDGQPEIYVMNADGSSQTRLTNNSAWDTAPAWSPDGTKILFTSLRDNPMSPSLYIMDADGSNQTRVTTGGDGVWRSNPTPVVYSEESTGVAAAVTAVTMLRGPFQMLDPYNFSVDGRTRVTLFTSNLGIVSPPVPPTSTLSVQANGVNLPIENVGPITGTGAPGGSYIIVRLPDGLPKGNLALTITLRGLTSTTTILPIAQ